MRMSKYIEDDWNGEYINEDKPVYLVNGEIVGKDNLWEETVTYYYDDDGNEFKKDEVKEYENLNELIKDINYNINSLKEEILELEDNKNTESLIKSKEKYIKEYQEILEKIKEEEE
jgi:hypothetical protein|nr:MAG TPA: hypothetical protein [Caudoviricetes sp.]